MSRSGAPWWRGARGEWFVVAQAGLLALILFGPRDLPFLPVWPSAWAQPVAWFGGGLMAVGAAMGLLSAGQLGRNLTPLPHPRDEATLVVGGLYRRVRHPLYGSVILMAVGWALWVQGTLTLLTALALGVFFDIKARREEAWLLQRFPEYAAYRQRVRKLIPFVY